MGYKTVTPEKWVERLAAGEFKSDTSAKKSIARSNWSKNDKDHARKLIEQHFSKPGSVTEFRPPAEVAQARAEARSARLREKPLRTNTPEVQGELLHAKIKAALTYVRTMTGALQSFADAKKADPALDSSEGQMLMNNIAAAVSFLQSVVRFSEDSLAASIKGPEPTATPTNGKKDNKVSPKDPCPPKPLSLPPLG